MYELICPACNTPSHYDTSHYLLLCPICSATFRVDLETNQKDLYADHYIVPASANSAQAKAMAMEWLRRLNHTPGSTEREYFITQLSGVSIPFWVVSLEALTAWKGLVQKKHRARTELSSNSDHIMESGRFRRTYRWSISGRHNICESWGFTRLHDPKESVRVVWDGFPLDSTLSRGQISKDESSRSAYDSREFFDFKFTNGLALLGIQVSEEEALRRAKLHVELYHLELARLNVDHLIDCRTEIEVAGVQLLHLPFWLATYRYTPKSMLRHFYTPKEKQILIEGFSNGILQGELPIQRYDKLWINAAICLGASGITMILGLIWHPVFFMVSLFALIIAAFSAVIATRRDASIDTEADASRLASPPGDTATA